MRIAWLAIVIVITASAPRASADPQLVLMAGTSRGGDAQLLPGTVTPCPACLGAGIEPPTTAGDGQLATLALGLIGTEGLVRGGGELFTILGLGERTTGYAGLVTYAGFDQGRLFAHAGLGIGSYWGDGRAGTLAAVAGDARAEIGLRLHARWLAVGRADYLLNDISATTVGTLAVQYIP